MGSIDAGQLKALEHACAPSGGPFARQAAEYRKAQMRYVDSKVAAPPIRKHSSSRSSLLQREDASAGICR